MQKTNGGPSDSALQALDWVPIDVSEVEHVWRVGIDSHLDSLVTMMLASAHLPVSGDRDKHDLDFLLGCPGISAPWLAITIVTTAIQEGAGAQFVVSGDAFLSTDVWGFVVTPAPLRSI